MELTDYVRILRKHWLTIVAMVLVGVGVGAVASLIQTPQYQATTQVFVSTQSGDTSAELAQGNTYTLSRVKTYAQLASSEQVLAGVVSTLTLDVDTRDLARRITATPILETTIIEISATSPDPVEAADIANATAASLATVVAQVESTGEQASPVRLTTVEQAVVPDSAISPRTTVNIALGALVALVLAIALAILRTVLDTRIRSSRDLAAVTSEPLLGSIAFDPKARQRPLIVDADPLNPRAEAYRALRTNLQFIEVDGTGGRTFVMTSSLPGEGKSTTSANLAISLADAGETVLLVDADLRKPKTAEYMGIEGRVGLTDVLIGRVPIVDAVQEWGRKGLYVLPAGRIPPNPSELLGSKTMAALLTNLEAEFDWVIIDAPPLLPVTDAAVLATHAAGAIVAVSAGRTTQHQLTSALGHLSSIDAPVAGVVLTMVPTSGADRYGYGYGYGYEREASSADAQRAEAPPRRRKSARL